jgi:hypothetical protein
MKKRALLVSTLVCSAVLATAPGCNRQSRGNADANANRAASPAEGGGTSTQASAGDPKNFGDTQAKAQTDGRSPSASPTGRSQDTNAAHNVQTTGAGASTPAPSQGGR